MSETDLLLKMVRQPVKLYSVATLFHEFSEVITKLEHSVQKEPTSLLSEENWHKQFLKFAQALPAHGSASWLNLDDALQAVAGNSRSAFLHQLIAKLKSRHLQVLELNKIGSEPLDLSNLPAPFYVLLPESFAARITLLVQDKALPCVRVSFEYWHA